MAELATIKTKRGTASQWTAINPVLAEGELGLETDTLKFKFGDGAADWNSLSYAADVAAEATAREFAIDQEVIARNTAISQAIAPFVEDAPYDGKVYGRQNGAWVEVIGG
jgi:hypothetical protein